MKNYKTPVIEVIDISMDVITDSACETVMPWSPTGFEMGENS